MKGVDDSELCTNYQLEEASIQNSAKTHSGNVSVALDLDLSPSTLK